VVLPKLVVKNSHQTRQSYRCELFLFM